jgi:hypothetical protein
MSDTRIIKRWPILDRVIPISLAIVILLLIKYKPAHYLVAMFIGAPVLLVAILLIVLRFKARKGNLHNA